MTPGKRSNSSVTELYVTPDSLTVQDKLLVSEVCKDYDKSTEAIECLGKAIKS